MRRKGFNVTLKVLFGAFVMVLVLLFVVMFSNTLMSRGQGLMEMISISNYLPGGG